MVERRQFLARAGQWAVAGGFLGPVAAVTRGRATIAVPGPGNLLFLPIALARKIGADAAEGLELDIRYTGGGPQAIRAMLESNSDFAAAGLSALALQKLNGKPVVCVVPLTRVPAYTLLVRANLRGQVRQIADLRGRVVGVKGHVPGGRSTSQLFAEHLLAQAGLKPDEVNYVSAGQSYDSQHAALASGAVDAIVGDEPFVTRLVRRKVAFALADYHDPETTRKQMGGLFLNGMVATREDMIAERSELVARLVKSLKRTLLWIDTHSAEEMVAALAPGENEERDSLRDVLRARKNIYSPDGRISDEQLATVDRFLQATEPEIVARGLSVRSLVDARWAGTAP
jgi:NitT/TauT family transport system substrate-binding protein